MAELHHDGMRYASHPHMAATGAAPYAPHVVPAHPHAHTHAQYPVPVAMVRTVSLPHTHAPVPMHAAGVAHPQPFIPAGHHQPPPHHHPYGMPHSAAVPFAHHHSVPAPFVYGHGVGHGHGASVPHSEAAASTQRDCRETRVSPSSPASEPAPVVVSQPLQQPSSAPVLGGASPALPTAPHVMVQPPPAAAAMPAGIPAIAVPQAAHHAHHHHHAGFYPDTPPSTPEMRFTTLATPSRPLLEVQPSAALGGTQHHDSDAASDGHLSCSEAEETGRKESAGRRARSVSRERPTVTVHEARGRTLSASTEEGSASRASSSVCPGPLVFALPALCVGFGWMSALSWGQLRAVMLHSVGALVVG